jgi:hypothetical protein
MTTTNKLHLKQAFGAAVLGALALAGSPAAWAQQEQGRVISSTAIRTADGVAGYSVTYEYAGRQYSTRTDGPPGDFIAVQVTPMGVMASQPQYEASAGGNGNNPNANAPEPWRNAAPEPGVVISGGSVPPAPIPAPQVIYQSAPAVVYPAPAPVYVAPGYYGGYGGYGGYGYGYPAYAYPPIGLSLNFGYSYSRGYRRWR